MFDNERKLTILKNIENAIKLIESQSAQIKSPDDFLLSQEGMFMLGGICMQLIFIGENVKTLDNKTEHEYLKLYPEIPWHDIMGLRDIIVHEYHRVDEEEIYSVIKKDIPSLSLTISRMISELNNDNS
jgi:uncharacterized protein with HEPN domain